MRVELLCLDVDGTLTDGSLIYGFSNSPLTQSLRELEKSTLDGLKSYLRADFPAQPTNLAQDTRIALAKNLKNAESALDSANSQNLGENNPRASANLETRPLRGAKNRIQGCRSATADFLLEAEKRGSPPKSEKRQLLARRGSEVGGAALLREKTSEFDGKVGAESIGESQGGLPRRFCESARNDEILDSSLRLRSAQNDKNSTRVAESSVLSHPTGCERSEAKKDAEFAEIVKVFNAKDGLALAYWTKSLNRKVAIITGKKSEILRHRARELGIEFLFMGVSDKGKIVRDLKKDLGLDSTQIAAIGDDLNDISMFAESSLNFAPRDCAQHLKTLPNIEILRCKGGRGAVREAIEIILQKEGIYEDFISVFAR